MSRDTSEFIPVLKVMAAVLALAAFAAVLLWGATARAHGVHPGSCDLPGFSPELHEHREWLDEITGGDVPYLCIPAPETPTPEPEPTPTPTPIATPTPTPTPIATPTPTPTFGLWQTEIARYCLISTQNFEIVGHEGDCSLFYGLPNIE